LVTSALSAAATERRRHVPDACRRERRQRVVVGRDAARQLGVHHLRVARQQEDHQRDADGRSDVALSASGHSRDSRSYAHNTRNAATTPTSVWCRAKRATIGRKVIILAHHRHQSCEAKNLHQKLSQ
jgi:hypothetical protein